MKIGRSIQNSKGAIMLRSAFFGFSIIAFVIRSSFAVDGIAVSMKTHTAWVASNWDTTWKYEIKNDDVVKATPLFTGKSRYATISVAGTHMAFFNQAADGSVYISVMPLAGGTVVNLCKANSGSYTCGGAIMYWAVDDWIYFTNSNNGQDGDATMYRVNYKNPGTSQVFRQFRVNLPQGAFSYDGSKAFFTLAGTGVGMSRFTFTGGGIQETNWCGVNCGAGLSPSGTYLLDFGSGAHTVYDMQTWGNTGHCSNDLPSVSSYNAWCVNCAGWDTCTKDASGATVDPFYYTVGAGASGNQNRFSVNSDKWFCSDIGMGNMGRYQPCSGNQILINWVDHKTINVSRNPRSCLNASDPQCKQNVPNRWSFNEGGSFIVTAPATDILPELRNYLAVGTSGNRPPGTGRRASRNALNRSAADAMVYDMRGVRMRMQASAGIGIVVQGAGRESIGKAMIFR
jgi:hypothetical protein